MDFFDPGSRNFLFGIGGLLALLTAGYYAVLWIRRSLVEDSPPGGDELLDPLREAYKRGSMGTDEFERVQAMLGAGKPATLEDELFAARRRKASGGQSQPDVATTPEDAGETPAGGIRTGDSGGSPPESG
ncbi:MAG: hypothetical protein U0800_11935 [Isosphaeraceae bacterium]